MLLFRFHPLSETFLKKLVGVTEIEDAMRRLDKLTQEELLMAAVQGLKDTRGVIGGAH
jgi:hypothetical protein